MIKIAADISSRPAERAQFQILQFRDVSRQQTPLGFFRQCKVALERLALFDTLHHLDTLKHVAGIHSQPVQDLLVETGERMHRLGAVKVEDAEDFGRVSILANT